MERFDQAANIERLIVNTVAMLCKNSISYMSELRIQGTVGITVDASRIVLIHLNECFQHGAESSQRNASVHDGSGVADSVQVNTHSLADSKRPRMSVVQCARRPFGRGRGRMRVPILPVQRARGRGTVQRARQQLVFPSQNKSALTKLPDSTVQQLPLSQCASPHFQARHAAPSNIPLNETQLSAKLEVGEGPSDIGMTSHLPMSSDVICVESDDDETETKPVVSTSRLNSASVKSEGPSHDPLQMIVDRAVVAARATNPSMIQFSSPSMVSATASPRSTVSSMAEHADSTYCGIGNPTQADIKPTLESSDMLMQHWTPTKRLILSPSKMLLGTPTAIKSEVCALPQSPVFSSLKPLRPGSASSGCSLETAHQMLSDKSSSQRNAASWTSVTETTFICTTAGCTKRFTTKRALVRHQKDKHGLVTQQMLTAGGQLESDSASDTGSGML